LGIDFRELSVLHPAEEFRVRKETFEFFLGNTRACDLELRAGNLFPYFCENAGEFEYAPD
jgi:hypothetical protein